jgi:hypothetical protein
VHAGVDGDPQLGADAVGRGDQQRILVAGGLEVEQRAETAQAGFRAGRRVALARGLIASTSALPASISTPASA